MYVANTAVLVECKGQVMILWNMER